MIRRTLPSLFRSLWFTPAQETPITTAETSALAETANRPNAASQRQRVYDLLAMSPSGLTDEGMQEWLNLDGNTQRPRRRELELAGRIRKAGTRRNRNGKLCVVWVVTAPQA